MALAFEVKYSGIDWATGYSFTTIRGGITGRHQVPQLRRNQEWVPGVDDPIDFGADHGERIITVKGVLSQPSHSSMIGLIETMRSDLVTIIDAAVYKKLIFGDYSSYAYMALPLTFDVDPISSALSGLNVFITVSFTSQKELVAA